MQVWKVSGKYNSLITHLFVEQDFHLGKWVSAFWKSLAWMASVVKILFPTPLQGYWTPYPPGYSTLRLILLLYCYLIFSFFSSELKPVVPADTLSLSSAGIPFKGAVWSLLHDVLEVNFLECKSHHTFWFPAECFSFFHLCSIFTILKIIECVFFKICASKFEERLLWYVNLLTCGLDRNKTYLFINSTAAMDDPPRPPMDSTRSLEMSGYMPCRGDFDMVRNWIYC